jgi:hypothetical protein
MTLLIGILLLAAFAFYLYYISRGQILDNIQGKPLGGTHGGGYEDTEFAEDFTFDTLKVDPEIESDFLPTKYGEDRLVLMAKDPDWLYAYWEVTANAQKKFYDNINIDAWHNSQPILRIYNLTQNDHFDININDESDNWYIRIGKPNTRFKAEIGFIWVAKKFICLTRLLIKSLA